MQAEDIYALARLKNVVGTAEGSNLSPRQVGANRVPIVTNLQLVRTQIIAANTLFTITWTDAPGNVVDHYNIYVNNTGDPSGTGVAPFSVQASPAFITVPTTAPNSVIFILIQTALKNGMVSNLLASPSITGVANNSQLSNGITADPTSVAFAAVVGGPVSAQNVQVYNYGALINISSSSFVPDASSPYFLNISLSGSTAQFSIASTLIAAGSYSGVATLTTALGSVNVPVTFVLT